MSTAFNSQAIDFLLVDWKLTVFPFFLHGLFVVDYAESSNERDIFARFTRSTNMPKQISRLRVTEKKANYFYSMLFSFSPRVCF